MKVQELKFNLKLQEVPINIVDLDGKDRVYKLKELTGEQRDIYLGHFKFSMTVVNDKPQLQTGEDFQAFSAVQFLAMCLYDEDDKPIPEDAIKQFPATVISQLHKAAQTLSGLDEEGKKAAKKD